MGSSISPTNFNNLPKPNIISRGDGKTEGQVEINASVKLLNSTAAMVKGALTHDLNGTRTSDSTFYYPSAQASTVVNPSLPMGSETSPIFANSIAAIMLSLINRFLEFSQQIHDQQTVANLDMAKMIAYTVEFGNELSMMLSVLSKDKAIAAAIKRLSGASATALLGIVNSTIDLTSSHNFLKQPNSPAVNSEHIQQLRIKEHADKIKSAANQVKIDGVPLSRHSDQSASGLIKHVFTGAPSDLQGQLEHSNILQKRVILKKLSSDFDANDQTHVALLTAKNSSDMNVVLSGSNSNKLTFLDNSGQIKTITLRASSSLTSAGNLGTVAVLTQPQVLALKAELSQNGVYLATFNPKAIVAKSFEQIDKKHGGTAAVERWLSADDGNLHLVFDRYGMVYFKDRDGYYGVVQAKDLGITWGSTHGTPEAGLTSSGMKYFYDQLTAKTVDDFTRVADYATMSNKFVERGAAAAQAYKTSMQDRVDSADKGKTQTRARHAHGEAMQLNVGFSAAARKVVNVDPVSADSASPEPATLESLNPTAVEASSQTLTTAPGGAQTPPMNIGVAATIDDLKTRNSMVGEKGFYFVDKEDNNSAVYLMVYSDQSGSEYVPIKIDFSHADQKAKFLDSYDRYHANPSTVLENATFYKKMLNATLVSQMPPFVTDSSPDNQDYYEVATEFTDAKFKQANLDQNFVLAAQWGIDTVLSAKVIKDYEKTTQLDLRIPQAMRIVEHNFRCAETRWRMWMTTSQAARNVGEMVNHQEQYNAEILNSETSVIQSLRETFRAVMDQQLQSNRSADDMIRSLARFDVSNSMGTAFAVARQSVFK